MKLKGNRNQQKGCCCCCRRRRRRHQHKTSKRLLCISYTHVRARAHTHPYVSRAEHGNRNGNVSVKYLKLFLCVPHVQSIGGTAAI